MTSGLQLKINHKKALLFVKEKQKMFCVKSGPSLSHFYSESTEKLVLENKNLHKSLAYIPNSMEVMAMHVPKGRGVEREKHQKSSQMICCISGEGEIIVETQKKHTDLLIPGACVIIPPDTFHTIVNKKGDLKLLTIYAPPLSSSGTTLVVFLENECAIKESVAFINHKGESERFCLVPVATGSKLYIHDIKKGEPSCREHFFKDVKDYEVAVLKKDTSKNGHVCPKCDPSK